MADWNKKRTSVKIVLSYMIFIGLAGRMKRPVEIHEVMGLAILAGAFVHGLLMGVFAF